jgi:acyl-CoA synthetase (AMP-forming)/AMP-acid ligase II
VTESIAGELGTACRRYAGRVAIRSAGEELTYAELGAEIRRAAETIGRTGEPACYFATANSIRALVALYGTLAAGVVPFLADPLWPSEVREQIARFYGLRTALGDPAYGWPVAEPPGAYGISPVAGVPAGAAPALRPSTRFARFTTGSTGRPRALEFTDAAALAAARGWAQAAGLTGESRVLILASIHNGLSFNTSLLSVFLTGGTLLLHEGQLFPSAVARSVERLEATELVAFPFVFELLMSQGPRFAPAFRRLRRAVSSAAKLSDDVAARWDELVGTPIANYYGIAEAGPVTFNDGSRDSLGRPILGNEIAIEEDTAGERPGEGRIRVRTPSMASGYVPDGKAPMHLTPDGFLRTSDRGYLRADGSLVLTGRLGDVVNIAGMKVDPAEIAESVRTLEGVLDVVVRAEESATRTFLAAYVESDVLTPAAVRDYCVRRFTGHKIPQKIRVLAKLPRSASGKVISSALS